MSDTQVLDNARKYYDWVLKEQYAEFNAGPANFRSLVNLASSLFHFHEWLFVSYPNELQKLLQQPHAVKSAGEFWGLVESTNPKFGFVRDIANSSKHVELTRKPSTSMTHMANTVIKVATYDSSTFDNAVFDAPYVASKDGPNDVLFDTCATELFAYWTAMIDTLHPPAS